MCLEALRPDCCALFVGVDLFGVSESPRGIEELARARILADAEIAVLAPPSADSRHRSAPIGATGGQLGRLRRLPNKHWKPPQSTNAGCGATARECIDRILGMNSGVGFIFLPGVQGPASCPACCLLDRIRTTRGRYGRVAYY